MVSVIDFKSVGNRPPRNLTEEDVKNKVSIGIRTPMRMGQGDGLFAMNKSLANEVRQNLHNLLLTNWGERVGRYQYGGNLQELTMELGSEGFDDEASVRIKNATSRWMPYLVLTSMERHIDTKDEDDLARVRLRIMYDVPPAKLRNQAVDITFYIAG